MFLHVGGAESLPCARAQRGDRVGLNAHGGGHLTRLAPLDLEVPQHFLPALWQGRERAGHHHGVHLAHYGVLEQLHTVQRPVRLGVHGTRAAEFVGAVRSEPGHGRNEVGAQELPGALALLEQREHARERLGDEVLRFRLVAGMHAGHGQCRPAVPFVERGEGMRVTLADRA